MVEQPKPKTSQQSQTTRPVVGLDGIRRRRAKGPMKPEEQPGILWKSFRGDRR
jgi:hypothetical protein